MLWARSKNAKRRLEAIVETMYENIENKLFFLLENYNNSLGIKGFSHNYTNSLRTASVYSTGTYAPPCISLTRKEGTFDVYLTLNLLFGALKRRLSDFHGFQTRVQLHVEVIKVFHVSTAPLQKPHLHLWLGDLWFCL